MASHRAAAALVLIVSLLVAIALAGVDARPTVGPSTSVAPLHGSNTSLTVRHDAHGQGYVADAVASALPEAEPDCGDDEPNEQKKHKKPKKKKHKKHSPPPSMEEPMPPHIPEPRAPKPPEPTSDTRLNVRLDAHGPGYMANAAAPEAEPTCDTCEDPEPEPPEPTCNTCETPPPEPICSTCEPSPEPTQPEPEAELTCNKVHGVKEGETCYSVAQCAGVTLDDFYRFNPNVCCDNLFIGQWVCVDANVPCD